MTGLIECVRTVEPYNRYDAKGRLREFEKNEYKCYCGNLFIARRDSINSGKTKSCGCLAKKNATIANKRRATHGLTNHRLYSTWVTMHHRCYNKKRKSYKNYGGRGIRVCKRRHDVKNFIEDMYPNYKEGLTLDRIDNNLDYCKENCKRSTYKKQANNSRRNKIYKGKSMSERADEIEITYYNLRSRLQRGWSREQAILTPKGERKKWLYEHS